MATETEMKQWLAEIAATETELAPFAQASYRAQWIVANVRHIFTFGRYMADLGKDAFQAAARALIEEGQHSHYTEKLDA